MNNTLYNIEQCLDQSNFLENLTPYFGILISLIALGFSINFSRKNVRLSIQQTLLKLVLDKAYDCNKMWVNEPDHDESGDHFKVLTELIITTEIVDKSFTLFEKNDSKIDNYKNHIYSIFWKQLTPDIRGWAKKKCDNFGNSENEEKKVEIDQIKKIKEIFNEHYIDE